MGYIFNLYKSGIKEIELSNASIHTLYQFGINEYLSTYKVYKNLYKTKYKSEYKNIHKKVKKLLELGLIKKSPRTFKNIGHNAIHYKITSAGIFYIIRKFNFFDERFEILKHHGDDEFFNIFLYPYFEKKTLIDLKFSGIFTEIKSYLKICCENLISLFMDLEMIEVEEGRFHWIDTWNYFHTHTKNVKELEKFIDILKINPKLKWLDLNIKINRNDENNIIISKDKEKIDLKLNDNEKQILVFYKNEILEEYRVVPIDRHTLSIRVFKRKTIEQEIQDSKERICNWIDQGVQDLSFSLVKYYEDNHKNTLENLHQINDIKILAKDKKFVKILLITESSYKKYFSKFKNLISQQ